MAFFDTPFDVNDLPESDNSFDLLPDGDYQVEIVKAEVKDTKAKDGQFIRLQMKVHAPTYAGRIIFGMINVRNKNEVAEKIGRQQLRTIMECAGLQRLEDTDQLIGTYLVVKVRTQPAHDGYEPSNTIKAYMPADTEVSAPASQAAPAKESAPAKKQAPWMKK